MKNRTITAVAAAALMLAAGCATAGAERATTAPAPTASASASLTSTRDPAPAPAAAPSAATAEPASSQPQKGAPGACTDAPDGAEIPGDADVKTIGDVDGDGRSDQLWIDAERNLGIALAGGGGATFAVQSAAPSAVSAMAVDADEQPPLEILVSDGRQVQLLVYDDCEIVPVTATRPQVPSPASPAVGEPWVLDLGFRDTGTGVACIEIFDRLRLVALEHEGRHGDTVDYSMVVLALDGRTASVEWTAESRYTSPAEDAAIERLTEVTCAEMRLSDGVTTPTP